MDKRTLDDYKCKFCNNTGSVVAKPCSDLDMKRWGYYYILCRHCYTGTIIKKEELDEANNQSSGGS